MIAGRYPTQRELATLALRWVIFYVFSARQKEAVGQDAKHEWLGAWKWMCRREGIES